MSLIRTPKVEAHRIIGEGKKLLLVLEIRFHVWQYKRKLNSRLQTEKRSKQKLADRWQSLELDQKQLVPCLTGLALTEHIQILQEFESSTQELEAGLLEQLARMDWFLCDMTNKPCSDRAELEQLLEMILKIRAVGS
jgi:hypothetical protein